MDGSLRANWLPASTTRTTPHFGVVGSQKSRSQRCGEVARGGGVWWGGGGVVGWGGGGGVGGVTKGGVGGWGGGGGGGGGGRTTWRSEGTSQNPKRAPRAHKTFDRQIMDAQTDAPQRGRGRESKTGHGRIWGE